MASLALRSLRRRWMIAVSPFVVLVACSSAGEAPGDDPQDAASGSSGTGSSSGDDAGSSGEIDAASSTSSSSSGQLPASCTDGIKNGDEADVDCGFACALRCEAGLSCNGRLDCQSEICTDGVCQIASDEDGVKNGSETDVDCGGPEARKCANPQRCLIASDCVSADCQDDGVCAPTHEDGVQNLDETDIDCGGALAGRCAPGRACNVRGDCDGGECLAGVCQAPTHADGVQNLGETDVDCGGGAPVRCGFDKKCARLADCGGNYFCNTSLATPLCKQPAIDYRTNGTESDIDCGGVGSPACANGFGCNENDNCRSGVCSATAPAAPGPVAPETCAGEVRNGGSCPAPGVVKHCAVPSNTDGVKNGNETDVDCGGAGNPTCAVAKACNAHSDCESDGCHAVRKVCVARRSCAMTYGGDTCGGPAGTELGGEDCCEAIEVARTPARRVALGKYLITAGRMRQMIERLNGDVRGYIQGLGLPANRWNPAWNEWLPTNHNEVARRLGPYAQPDENGFGTITGARGCQVSSNGGRPYWFNAGDGGGLIEASEAGRYPHDILDQKVMTCLMPPVAAAFCIWDGGELADPDDLDFAWNGGEVLNNANNTVVNTRKWPWGNLPDPPTNRFGTTEACVSSNCNSFLVHQWNYNYPAWAPPDSTQIVPAPGRRPAGAGPFGHMDLAGTGYQYAKRNPATGSSTLHTMNSGSFEGHAVTEYLTYGGATLNRRYWAFNAGRCSYPAPAP